MLSLLFTVFLQSAPITETVTETVETYRLIRVEGNSRAHTLKLIHDAGLDPTEILWEENGAVLPAEASTVERLQSLGAKVEIKIADMTEDFVQQNEAFALMDMDSPPLGLGSMGGYYTYDEIGQKLDELRDLFPNLISRKTSIGKSIQNRDIWAVRLSNDPNVDQDKPRAFLDAMHHAREPQGMMTLFHFTYYLCSSYGQDSAITQLIDNREIWIVPIVNPDGYAYNQQIAPNGGGMWRKNRHAPPGGSTCYGVDLNRNYSKGWGVEPGSSGMPCEETYRGTGAFSEPETLALSNFYLSKAPFGAGNSIHTYGYLHMYPWGYTSMPTLLSTQFNLLAAWQAELHHYLIGNVYSTLYPASGITTDWAYSNMGTMCFTSEIGESFWPTSNLIVPLAIENLEALKRLVGSAGPYLQNLSAKAVELGGNGNGYIDLKEKASIVASFQNYGSQAANNVELSISSSDPNVVILNPNITVSSIAAFSAYNLEAGLLIFQIKKTAVPGSTVAIELQFCHDGFTSTQTVTVLVGTPESVFYDQFETPSDWTVGGPQDTVPNPWGIANPISYKVSRGVSYSGQQINYEAQPENDASNPGLLAWVTGGTVPTMGADLDGQATLTSPSIDLTSSWNPRLRFSRYFSSYKTINPNFLDFVASEDSLKIEFSNNDGENWFPLANFAPELNSKWKQESFPVAEFFYFNGLELTSQTRFRVIAKDAAPDSTTEALIDEFRVDHFPPSSNTFTDLIDLQLTKELPHNIVSGKPFQYSLEVKNAGPDSASEVVLTVYAQNTEIGNSQSRLTFNLGTLASGEQKRVVITAVTQQGNDFFIQATVSFQKELGVFGKVSDTDLSNNKLSFSFSENH